MAEVKTKPTRQDARELINTIEPEERRKDGLAILKLFQKTTRAKPVMWGTSMVGFGMYHFKSERSTQEGDWPLVAFAPRKQHFTLYFPGIEANQALLERLGKHKMTGGCLHIKRLSDVDQAILTKLIAKSFDYMSKREKINLVDYAHGPA